jgi:hypothetical protein
MSETLTFDDVLAALWEGDRINPASVPARVQRRKLWRVLWSLPGCLPDWSDYYQTKAGALDAVREHSRDGETKRSLVGELRRDGISYTRHYVYEVHPCRVSECIG